jgi:hypothetical protein
MSGQSNVGNSSLYEAGDQRTVKDSEIEEQKKENRFHEGQEHSHKAQDPSMFTLLHISISSDVSRITTLPLLNTLTS